MLRLGNELADACSPGNWHDVSLIEVDNTRRVAGRQSSEVRGKLSFSQRNEGRLESSHITSRGRGGLLDCSVNSYNTLHTFSAFAPVSSHIVDHITGRVNPVSSDRKQVESLCNIHFDTF